ncbi:putative toxin-antitoxin system toxin component, PIN family [Chlorogloea sp. CCALA 695]|uniref:putative toxin-antitoxin system toxin component, PIN family n=1 Tax=Chlorogloea sp. CCALA 695 TaxID=2107693 RepID=UPI000D06E14B|nr:putative toxin-antitoxin system toxin component, PIN family [Chlorogloea sp. CCALA 695]PSB29973.1 putative toxin-antitoxin system toxin component, PIN family [Chlorogloea sp. CCALA 695]
MRVVDTNVLVSAVLKGKKPREVIQFIIDTQGFEWIGSVEVLAESTEVLSRRKLKLTDEIKEEWFKTINTVMAIIDVNVEINFPRDQKDAKFIACALAGGADFLITGDRDFTEAQTLMDTTIISVSLFKKLVCDVRNEESS